MSLEFEVLQIFFLLSIKNSSVFQFTFLTLAKLRS